MNLPLCMIVDLDGTLCDHRHRLHHVLKRPKNWDAFHDACVNDTPHREVVKICQALMSSSIPVILCSGRPDSHRDRTVEWLKRHDVPYDTLLMRPTGDYRRDTIIKREMLDLIRQYWEPMVAIDDRPSIVAMWRENGVPCMAMDGSEWEKAGTV